MLFRSFHPTGSAIRRMDNFAEPERHTVLMTGDYRIEVTGEPLRDLDQQLELSAEHRDDPVVQSLPQQAEVAAGASKNGAQLLLEQVDLIERLILFHQLVQQQLCPGA